MHGGCFESNPHGMNMVEYCMAFQISHTKTKASHDGVFRCRGLHHTLGADLLGYVTLLYTASIY